MKTKLTLLATGACVAFLFNPIRADIIDDLSPIHLGARHMLFTGTQTHPDYTNPGSPTTDGYGFRNAEGTSELTLSIPDLGITDLVITFSIVSNADRDADGNGSSWGEETYYPDNDTGGYTGGKIYVVGTDRKVSDTLTTRTREYGGCFWGGPLDGAHLLASERIEDTTESDGPVISSASVVEGVLIVSWYEGFAPFEEMDSESLPPLKPISDLPPGLPWRQYAVIGFDAEGGRAWHHVEHINCEELGIHDLWIPTFIDGPGFKEFGPVWGWMEFNPMGQGSGADPAGQLAVMGVWTPVPPTWGTPAAGYHEHTGAFWSGPFAGCLYMVSQRSDGIRPTDNSGLLLVPDSIDLGKPQKMLNISERGRVGTGEDILIAGFVVSGKLPKMMLVRAIGPGLAEYGVTDYLANPNLKVYKNADPEPILIEANLAWWRSENMSLIREAAESAGAFPLGSRSLDAAILFSWLEPGAYTAQVSSADGTTGVALVEVYEVGN